MKRTREPEDFSELKKKVSHFRIIDLQSILISFNLSKSGRKSELQDRLLSYYKDGKLKDDEKNLLKTKINEFYKKIVARTNVEISNSELMCSKASKEAETKRLKVSQDIDSLVGLPIQPDVRLKKIPFFEHLNTLLPPSTLTPCSFSLEQIKKFTFNLTPQQAVDIERNRVIKGAQVDYTVQVQLRLCLMESTSDQKDLYPQNLQIRINNRICPLPPFLPARPNTIAKRPSKPLNITPFVKVSPLTSNEIEVRWQKEPHKNFVITCFLVKQLSAANLFDRLKIKGEDFTRGMIKEKLSSEVDSEISTTMLRVSLLCPLGKIRMKMPCRASTCKHLQCFDTMLYLQMNEFKQSWICPVCDKEAVFENLVIDGYFLNVINTLSADVNEIQLHKDGSWSKLDEIQQQKQVQDNEGFVISDEEDDAGDVNNNSKRLKVALEKTKIEVKSVKEENKGKLQKPAESAICYPTIDLTLDD